MQLLLRSESSGSWRTLVITGGRMYWVRGGCTAGRRGCLRTRQNQETCSRGWYTKLWQQNASWLSWIWSGRLLLFFCCNINWQHCVSAVPVGYMYFELFQRSVWQAGRDFLYRQLHSWPCVLCMEKDSECIVELSVQQSQVSRLADLQEKDEELESNSSARLHGL